MTELALRQTNDVATIGPTANLPQSDGAMRLVEWAEEAQAAHHLANALVRTPFAGSWKGDIDGATAAILKGAEVGLTPVTALGAFDNIQGTPAPKAITLRALVQSHGHDLEIVEADDQHAVARYRRHGKGDWLTTEFTMDNARAMKLAAKDNWIKQPEAMLVARVTSKAARLVASDVILGIGYSAEEIRDESDWSERPSRTVQQPTSGAARMASVLGTQTSGPEAAPDDLSPSVSERSPAPGPESPTLNTSGALAKRMFATFNDLGITERANRLLYVSDVVGREVTSSSDMTDADAEAVIAALETDLEQPFPADENAGAAQGGAS